MDGGLEVGPIAGRQGTPAEIGLTFELALQGGDRPLERGGAAVLGHLRENACRFPPQRSARQRKQPLACHIKREAGWRPVL